MEYLISFVLGVFGSLIASGLFLWYLSQNKPKLEISPNIARNRANPNQPVFALKFVNKTASPIYDIRIDVTLLEPVVRDKGNNLKATPIVVSKDYLQYVENENGLDSYSSHAITLRITDDIDSKWIDEKNYIQVTITARHSLSGFSGVFTQQYRLKSCIVDGRFESGNSLKVSSF